MSDAEPLRVLVVEARFYEEIADQLAAGALAALEEAGCEVERVAVPGALEIPPAISFALDSEEFDAFVALGCVIRGETAHFDIVANESARGLMQLGIDDGAAIGNGVLTCENEEQAKVRADPNQKNKGGEAARAAIALARLRDRWGEEDD